MREIKFRAYHPATEKMLYDGAEWNFHVGTHLISHITTVLHYGVMHNIPAGGNHDYVKVVDKEGKASNYYSNWDYESVYQSVQIMQSTGLKDKNGKDIFEGDILFWDGSIIGEVQFQDAEYIAGEGRNARALSPIADRSEEEFEVIGNIYEHPDLLQDKGEE